MITSKSCDTKPYLIKLLTFRSYCCRCPLSIVGYLLWLLLLTLALDQVKGQLTSSAYLPPQGSATGGGLISPSSNWFGGPSLPPTDPYSQIKCPADEDMAPCTCDDNGDLECYGSTITDSVFKEVFTRLSLSNQKHLHALKLYKTDLTFLHQSIFGEITFACIDLNGNQNLSINSVHRTTFYKSKDIMTSFKITGLSDAYLVQKEENDGAIFENVDGFLQLNSYWLTAVRLPRIQRSAFGRCELPNVKTVYLPKNNIEEVGDYSFYRLPNLTFLNLRDNEISRIGEWTFSFEKTSEEILVLDLQGNIITSDAIHPKAFLQLNRPVTLNLHYNLITYLDEETFKPILQNPKSSIIISNNPIICDCRMKWLLEEAPDYMDRVHGLMCGGKNELWYFTPTELDIECNETVLTERYRAWSGGTPSSLRIGMVMTKDTTFNLTTMMILTSLVFSSFILISIQV